LDHCNENGLINEMKKALRIRNPNIPRQDGERARFKVVRGPDIGALYVVLSHQVTIGRGETSDLTISDLKASREHAEVRFDGNLWRIRDLKSANGIDHNGKNTREATLSSGDTIGLGETILEFYPSEAGTQILRAPARKLEEIERAKKQTDSHANRVKELISFGGLSKHSVKPASAASVSDGSEKRKGILYGVLGLVLFWVLFGDEGAEKSQERRPQSVETRISPQGDRSLENYLPQGGGQERNETAERFYQSGFREYQERNYLRAKNNFRTALQIAPNHTLAKLYLAHSENAIQEEIKFHLERGAQTLAAGSLRVARGHFESIQRLLHQDKTNPAYKEASDQLEEISKL
jgi:pSer/pThr/pTyr-binding forkhead associated (FHA) protein